jgi:hypothetical protein
MFLVSLYVRTQIRRIQNIEACVILKLNKLEK